MKYISTRSNQTALPSEAVLKGIASDGGLFVPEIFPSVPLSTLVHKSYQDLCFEIMSPYFDEFPEEELVSYIQQAYAKFLSPRVTPTVSFDSYHLLELFHGPTLAFKDVALSMLPHLMTGSASIQGVKDEIVVLTATSGDTGKAALEGFSDVKGTRVVVFYPKDGVSTIQKKQMTTQKGDNVHVVAIDGNFDDAQNGVKSIFSDKEFNETLKKKNHLLSSANSINIGRLVPQIVYYFASYSQAVQENQISLGDPINFVVPTGNFGNILAGYYAKQMGLPIKKLICASNENNVLYDFFATGKYNKNRPFILTSSPSMDILISSNFERLLYHVSQGDSQFINDAMKDLSTKGTYEVTPSMKKAIDEDFFGGYCTEEETGATIQKIYGQFGYVLDPHTAVAVKVYDDYVKETGDDTHSVILSTASPFKFTKSVYEAIFGSSSEDDIALISKLAKKTDLIIPADLLQMCESDDRHTSVCGKEDMKNCVNEILS
ncbi:threonine synthase [Alkalibacter rhizosphaerae]|uniref:Threonine synthase n=1 Tax=Alkalibacter rhizosphaerae TaxID=2815577 RepID=A0A974XIG9_9FIRM|nr:threonine synthase [Alkalibacter rhizosphaerae]QSX08973.1 threonine synthase [Alkalibacter rhizosphaerae]